jgi:hypothetical protein
MPLVNSGKVRVVVEYETDIHDDDLSGPAQEAANRIQPALPQRTGNARAKYIGTGRIVEVTVSRRP